MKLSGISLVIVLALFSSCSQDNIDPQPVTVDLKPVRYEEDNFTREYFYNDVNQLTQIKFVTTFINGGTITSVQNFSYRADGKIAEATSDTGFKFVYTYSGDRIIRTDEYVNGSWSEYHSFTYDQAGRIKEMISYQNIPEEGGIIPVSKDTYEYDNRGNLSVMKMYYYTSYGAEAKLQTVFLSSEYDDKVNSEELFEINIFNPYLRLNKNNPGKLVIQNGLGNTTSTEVYTYDYNEKGYAIKKRTDVTLYHGGTGSYSGTYIYK